VYDYCDVGDTNDYCDVGVKMAIVMLVIRIGELCNSMAVWCGQVLTVLYFQLSPTFPLLRATQRNLLRFAALNPVCHQLSSRYSKRCHFMLYRLMVIDLPELQLNNVWWSTISLASVLPIFFSFKSQFLSCIINALNALYKLQPSPVPNHTHCYITPNHWLYLVSVK
jgi:hypothetical protein